MGDRPACGDVDCSAVFSVGGRTASSVVPSLPGCRRLAASYTNDLPLPLRHKPSLDSFKCNLKTFIFPKRATFSVPCCFLHPKSSFV